MEGVKKSGSILPVWCHNVKLTDFSFPSQAIYGP